MMGNQEVGRCGGAAGLSPEVEPASSLAGFVAAIPNAGKVYPEYGCYVDLFDGDEPDDCVLSYGAPGDCTHGHTSPGRPRKTPHTCKYWRKRSEPSWQSYAKQIAILVNSGHVESAANYIRDVVVAHAAQGTEARQGGDGEAGSVHDGPVGSADAPALVSKLPLQGRMNDG